MMLFDSIGSGVVVPDDNPPVSEMPYERPFFTPTQVNRAGRHLVTAPDDIMVLPKDERDEIFGALSMVNNWRAVHAYPLNAIYVTLASKAKRIDGHADVVQRLKRHVSILDKLFRSGTMEVSQMQDIGGCRAVVTDLRLLNELVSSYETRPIRS